MTANRVLSLYRQMLRKGRQLKLTDRHYFNQIVRTEFKKNRNVNSSQDIKFQIEV